MIVNLTGHDINIVSNNDSQRVVRQTIPSSGIARVSYETQHMYSVDGIPVYRTIFGETTGLPEPATVWHDCSDCRGSCNGCLSCDDRGGHWHNVLYIVSKIVAEANPQRNDLLIVSETVRDGSTIIGCKGLSRLN